MSDAADNTPNTSHAAGDTASTNGGSSTKDNGKDNTSAEEKVNGSVVVDVDAAAAATKDKDKYNTPEEIKKQKLRDRKKNKRKRKRQQDAVSKAGEKKEGGAGDDDDEESEEEHKEHPLSIAETVKVLKHEAGITGDEQPKKKVYGIQMDLSDIPRGSGLGYDPVMDKFARAEGQQIEEEEGFKEPKKQHRGLRCNRCFSLLCRDDDFEYMNGQLNVTGESLKASWDGLIKRGGMVYCQKMHLVGYKKNVTFTNQSRSVVVLKVEKTTFKENYLENPAFAGSDKIKNRLQFQERGGNEGLWRQLSLPPEKFIPKEFAPADRYHGPGAE